MGVTRCEGDRRTILPYGAGPAHDDSGLTGKLGRFTLLPRSEEIDRAVLAVVVIEATNDRSESDRNGSSLLKREVVRDLARDGATR